jgi:MYXO-CTERM domain-containing protein
MWAPMAVEAAAEPARLGLTPIGQHGQFFELTMAAGQAQRLSVEVGNFGPAEVRARTYAADVYSIVNGGFGAALFGAQLTGTARWLDYLTRELTLKPGGASRIDFRVQVPKGTPPGQYVTSLVAESVQPAQGGAGSVAINQVNRVAIAVAIRIPGPSHPVIEIGAVSYKFAAGTSFVSFAVANPGNVHLKPTGELIVRDSAQTEIFRSAVAMDSVYAGTATRLETALAQPLGPGVYCAELQLTDAATKSRATASCQSFTVTAAAETGGLGGAGSAATPVGQAAIAADGSQPALPLDIIALPLALAALLLLLARRRREPSETKEAR